VKVLVLFNPKTCDLRAVLAVEGDQVASYFDPPDRYWETLVRTTLAQKPFSVAWEDFFEQLADRPPYSAWWELVSVGDQELSSAFGELL
jgi:hypothetical protein